MTNTSTKSVSEPEIVDCPVCGPAPSSVWMDDGPSTRYRRCHVCRTVYASPRASRVSRHRWLHETFSLGHSAIEIAAGRHGALAAEAAILQRLKSSGSILDIGCDLGVLFEWFSGREWQRHGVELSPSAATYASSTYSAQVFAGTLCQAAYPAAQFDLVTMIDMLYYVDNPKDDLREVVRVLKPNGFLAIEITGQAYQLTRSRGPLCMLLDRRWTRLQSSSSYLFWPHPGGLLRLLQDCGFQVVAWHVIPSPPQSNPVTSMLSHLHFTALSVLSRRFHKFLTLAPKYLCIAKLRGVGAEDHDGD